MFANVRCSHKMFAYFLFQSIFGTKSMQPFMEDPQLARHLAAQQPRPQRRPSPPAQASADTGTVVLFNGVYGWVCPAGSDPRQKHGHLFLHRAALARSGIADIMAGAVIRYVVKPSRRPGGRPECREIEILEP
jgi:hypothetical protein